jgi:hypothetical protein
MSEAVGEAAARLERAVDRLAEILAQPRPASGIPPEQVAALSARLDNTLARLRGALAELDSASEAAPAAEESANTPAEAGPEAAAAAAPPTQDEER